jgi:hypothetical protein
MPCLAPPAGHSQVSRPARPLAPHFSVSHKQPLSRRYYALKPPGRRRLNPAATPPSRTPCHRAARRAPAPGPQRRSGGSESRLLQPRAGTLSPRTPAATRPLAAAPALAACTSQGLPGRPSSGAGAWNGNERREANEWICQPPPPPLTAGKNSPSRLSSEAGTTRRSPARCRSSCQKRFTVMPGDWAVPATLKAA